MYSAHALEPAGHDNGGAAKTDQELVAAIAGQTVKVAQIAASSDSTETILIEDGSTTLYKVYILAGDGVVVTAPTGEFLFETSEGGNVTYTSTATGNTYVHILYDQS
jgi:hypothetical protein